MEVGVVILLSKEARKQRKQEQKQNTNFVKYRHLISKWIISHGRNTEAVGTQLSINSK